MVSHAILRSHHSGAFLLANPTDDLVRVFSLHVPGLLDDFRKDLVAEETFEVFVSGLRLALLWLCAKRCNPRCSFNLWLWESGEGVHRLDWIVHPGVVFVFNVSRIIRLCLRHLIICGV